MRPIVNLGKSSRIVFRNAVGRQCRSLPAQRTVLSFRPVNCHLQQLHRVRVDSLSALYVIRCTWPQITK